MPRHIPSLDGLRAIAVLLVLWSHAPHGVDGYPDWLKTAHWLASPGGLGVELFFALSGFLITRILLVERQRGQAVRWFLLRRLLRIFPIYYLLIVVVALVEPTDRLAWYLLYLNNFTDVIWPPQNGIGLGHTWSLCVEEHFYLLWPLVVAWTAPRTSRRVLLWGVIPTAILSALALCWFLPAPRSALIVQSVSPVRFGTLAAGALVAFAEPWLRQQPNRLLRLGALLIVLGLALHPHIWFLYVPFFVLQAPWWPLDFAPAGLRIQSAIFATGILLVCLQPRRSWLSPARLLSNAPLRAIGRISYAVYLYHMPIYRWVILPQPTVLRTCLAVALTLAVAAVSYWLIERPILRYAARFRSKPSGNETT
ncbi:MAG: acyltransferase family protein [Planctomycetota bacterium]